MLDSSACMDCMPIGSGGRDKFSPRDRGYEEECMDSVIAGTLAHAILKLSTNYPTRDT